MSIYKCVNASILLIKYKYKEVINRKKQIKLT